MSGTGYLGFIAGPPAVGLLSEAIGLRSALLLVAVLCALATAARRRGARAGQSSLKKLIPRSSIRDRASEFRRVSSFV